MSEHRFALAYNILKPLERFSEKAGCNLNKPLDLIEARLEEGFEWGEHMLIESNGARLSFMAVAGNDGCPVISLQRG